MRRRNRLRHLGLLRPHSTSRSSPSRRVMFSRSRNSSSGMAYLREMPVHSLNAGTLKRARPTRGQQLAQLPDRRLVKHQLLIDAHQPLFAQQNFAAAVRARARLHARFRQHLRHRGHRQPRLLEGALDGGARLLLILPEHQLCGRASRTVRPRPPPPSHPPAARPARKAGHRAMPAAQVLLGDARQQRVCRWNSRTALTSRSRAAWNHARSIYQGCGCAIATSGAWAAAAAMSPSAMPVRATSSAMPMPKSASRTSRAMRAAASAAPACPGAPPRRSALR